MRILVNNIHSTNSTALVKMLKRINKLDIEVWGTDTENQGQIASSNMVDRYFQAPDIDNNIEFLNFLEPLCKENKIDLIFVSSDKEVRFMSKYKNQLNSIVICPTKEIVDLFSDKYEASLAIEKLNIKCPPIINDFFHSSKVIFRKKCSVSSLGIYIADLSSDNFLENHFHDSWFAQKYIDGTVYVVDVFSDKNGVPKLILPRKKLEVQNGSAFRSQLINHTKIIDFCKLIYSHYKIPGISNIEFIEDNNGEIYFIEINLRIGGSASEGIAASFNYIEHYLNHFVLGKDLKSLDYYMQFVEWNAVISRFYEESVFSEKSSHFKSYIQKDK